VGCGLRLIWGPPKQPIATPDDVSQFRRSDWICLRSAARSGLAMATSARPVAKTKCCGHRGAFGLNMAAGHMTPTNRRVGGHSRFVRGMARAAVA